MDGLVSMYSLYTETFAQFRFIELPRNDVTN